MIDAVKVNIVFLVSEPVCNCMSDMEMRCYSNGVIGIILKGFSSTSALLGPWTFLNKVHNLYSIILFLLNGTPNQITKSNHQNNFHLLYMK